MRLSKPGSKASRASASKLAGTFGTTVRRVLLELYGITRELLRIPVALFMRAAEFTGALVLAAWLRAWPVLLALWRLGRRALAIAQVELSPARVTLAVVALTAVALAASQFADYRQVTIGSDAYSAVEGVASAPPIDTASTGSAHAWLGLPLALLAVLVAAGAATGRPRLAALLVPVGLAAVALSVFVDRPKGLDEGDAAIAYDGASAALLAGFWAQLVSGAVLAVLAPLLWRALEARSSTDSGGAEPRERASRAPWAKKRARPGRRPFDGASREAGA